MCCLMRRDYTVWLSPSSHDNRVTVAPFNPIAPTWPETNNSRTPYLPTSFLSARSSPVPQLPDTRVTVFSFFIAQLQSLAAPLLLFSSLLLLSHTSVSVSVSSVFWLSREKKKSKALITRVKALPTPRPPKKTSFHSPEQ